MMNPQRTNRTFAAFTLAVLVLAGSAALLPSANASEEGPTLCPPYNDGALTNLCFRSTLDTLQARVPEELGATGTLSVCPVGDLCLNATTYGITEYETVDLGPTLHIDEFWIEATALCPFVGKCRVEIDPKVETTLPATLADLDQDHVLDSLLVEIDDAWYLFPVGA